MSWNLGYPEIKSATVAAAKELLAANTSPKPIKDYVEAAIGGLEARHGADVLVTVTGSGHLCDVANKNSLDETTATIKVSRAV